MQTSAHDYSYYFLRTITHNSQGVGRGEQVMRDGQVRKKFLERVNKLCNKIFTLGGSAMVHNAA